MKDLLLMESFLLAPPLNTEGNARPRLSSSHDYLQKSTIPAGHEETHGPLSLTIFMLRKGCQGDAKSSGKVHKILNRVSMIPEPKFP